MIINRTKLFLIGSLVAILIATVGVILVQNTRSQQKSTNGNNYSKSMIGFKVKNDLQNYGIDVVSSSDFNFDAELEKYVGDDENLISQVNSVKPFTLFIKNNSSKDIVGISLRWRFTGGNGSLVEIPQSEANPGVLIGIKPIDPKMIGKTSLINSKDVKFFTYFKDIVGNNVTTGNMRVKNPNSGIKLPSNDQLDTSYLNSQKEKMLIEHSDFSVSIDGVFFEDGTFVGEDRNFFFDSLRGDIQARKDILADLDNGKALGKNNTNIIDEILNKTSNIFVDFTQLNSENVTSEQVFDISYKSYLKNLRSELIMKQSRMSDTEIVKQFQNVKLTDFVTLKKVATDFR